MRPSKSQPKMKFSVNKYPNFFTDKKWDDPMYMDDRNAQSSDLANAIASYSSMTIQPRAKLSLSLHEKVGAVLVDSRKIGMIDKVDNASTRKSLAKISYVSTLPPIKTQVQQMEEYLRKLKNELNDVSLHSIKTSKEVSNLQASINQTKQKCRVLQDILGRTGEKELKQISDRKQVTEQLKYSHDVRMHMHQNLKSDIQVLAKCKRLMQQKLKTLKIQLSSLNTHLNNSMASLNNNIYTKRQYQTKQELTSEQIMIRSENAQNKLIHQRNAQRIHHKIQGIQGYGEDQFRYQTNLQNHFNTLKELRAQQVLSKMLDCLFHKYQLHWQQYEKSYGLMRMYFNFSKSPERIKNNIKTESTIANKLVKNLSIKSNSSVKQLEGANEIDLSLAYGDTFTYKKQLQDLIKQKQKILKQLQQKKQKLYNLWASKTLEDSVTQGAKVTPKKVDFSKEIKNLLEKEKRAQKNKLIEQEIDIWLERQGEKLNFVFSKKMSKGDKIVKILEYLKSEFSNYKSQQIKKQIKSQKKAQVAGKATTNKKGKK